MTGLITSMSKGISFIANSQINTYNPDWFGINLIRGIFSSLRKTEVITYNFDDISAKSYSE